MEEEQGMRFSFGLRLGQLHVKIGEVVVAWRGNRHRSEHSFYCCNIDEEGLRI